MLDDVIRDLYPPKPGQPCTFGLTLDERRKHRDQLVNDGWSPGEIGAVLNLDGARWPR
jgi:hypothetical protein